jgi:hypothetical protein
MGHRVKLDTVQHLKSYSIFIICVCNPILFAVCASSFSRLCVNVYSGL